MLFAIDTEKYFGADVGKMSINRVTDCLVTV